MRDSGVSLCRPIRHSPARCFSIRSTEGTLLSMSGMPSIPESVSDAARFQRAIELFDQANAADPNVETIDGEPQPRELLYARRLYNWVRHLLPNASETLLLAARCQHICRWIIPRESYPKTRPGYLKWRNDLKIFHSKKAGEILVQAGYSQDLVSAVQALNLKKNFPHDPESCALEDALCLVFLQFQFGDLARKTSEEQMLNALRKSWKKMTPAGQEQALKLVYTPEESRLLKLALA